MLSRKEQGKKPLLLFISIFTFLAAYLLPAPQAQAQMLQEGEVLEYEVSYLGITLGSIVVKTLAQEEVDGKPTTVVSAEMKSSPGIPFVTIDVLYKSWIDPSSKFTHKFYASEVIDEADREYTKYKFDYPGKFFEIETGSEKDGAQDLVKIESTRRWNDGLSLFFLARQFLNIKRHIAIPTIIQSDTTKTSINFVGTPEEIDIDAVDYDVSTTYFRGNADWEGIYGVTGRFEGWFSADEARVPIKAKMKVYLGNVNIELTRWQRGTWSPPKAKG